MAGRRDETVEQLLVRMRAMGAAFAAVNEAAAARYGVGPIDLRGMEIVARHDGMSAGDLAQALGLSTGAITGLIDRGEQAGYLRRDSDGSDRRRVIVRPTAAGGRRTAEVFGRLIDACHRLLASYSDAELRVIAGFLDRAAVVLDEQAAELRQPARRRTKAAARLR